MATFLNGVMSMSRVIQLKMGTAAALTASDYVPAAGELVGAIYTGELRIGDGIHTLGKLPSYDRTQIANNYT